MTVAGQKNHYNVKLLKGYGASINLKDNRICLKGGRDPFTGEQDAEEWFVTQIPYERIVISGKGYLSTEAVKLLTDHNINIILTDTYGNLITAMHNRNLWRTVDVGSTCKRRPHRAGGKQQSCWWHISVGAKCNLR